MGIKSIIVNAADVPQTDKESKTKTDRIDSRRIAKALRADMHYPVYVPDEEIEADRQLVRMNERLGQDLIRYKNRIKGLLYQVGINIPDQQGKKRLKIYLTFCSVHPERSEGSKH